MFAMKLVFQIALARALSAATPALAQIVKTITIHHRMLSLYCLTASIIVNRMNHMRNLILFSGFIAGLSLHAQTTPAAELPETPAQFSVWSQRLDMSQYMGKKYRLTVAIRAEPATPESFATAFIRNEFPKGGLRAWTFMDNMMDRPVRDTTWKTYTLEYVVDDKAPWIAFGVLAFSSGVYYYDNFQLAVETAKNEWTPLPIPNGDFEQTSLAPWQQTAQGVPVRVLGAHARLDDAHPFQGKQCLRVENVFLLKD